MALGSLFRSFNGQRLLENGALSGLSIGPGTPSTFTTGSVIFAGVGVLAEDNTNLFWDDTNNLLSIGNASRTSQRLVRFGQDTAFIDIGSQVGATSVGAIYFNQTTPSGTNYALISSGGTTALNATSRVDMRISNSAIYIGTSTNSQFQQDAATTGVPTPFKFTLPNSTNQTASTEALGIDFVSGTVQHATGALTLQRNYYFRSRTHSFVGASTVAEAFSVYIEAPTAGTNATVTNNFALGLLAGTATIKMGNLQGSTSTPAIYFNQTTPSGSNYILQGGATDVILNSPSADLTLRIANATRVQINPSATSGASTTYTFNCPSNTGQTLSTEITGYLHNSYTRTWNTGAITTQREQYIKTVTYAFGGVSTITNAYGLYVESPTAGTNATITNNFGLGVAGHINIINGGLRVSDKGIDTTAGDSATINSTAGRFRKDATGSTFTLTNSYITANSIIILQYASDPGITGFDNIVVAGAGSAVITFTTSGVAAAPTNNTDMNFWVIN